MGKTEQELRALAQSLCGYPKQGTIRLGYRRGDALEKRRALMEAWATFCEPNGGSVIVPLARPERGRK